MERIGIDTGGTFTDFVRIDSSGLTVHKVPSTPDDPARAVAEGLAEMAGAEAGDRLIHGTTVATNALLTRTGGPVAFVTTKGFEDVLEIGRQNRPYLYDLQPAPATPLIPRRMRFGVVERTLADGEVEAPLDEEGVLALVPRLRKAGVAAVAVGFLHAYARPENERRAAALLRKAGFTVTASHEVLPEYREYERFSTTAVNAYVLPVIRRYLTRLARSVGGERLAVMQSNGGIVSWRASVKAPVRTVLSGPAGGVVAALAAGRTAGWPRVISFDMGGTSTDVALADGEVRRTTEFSISGMPVALPVLDIHTVGAGGGSLARVDAGGALAVGPASAGADPGPACYGRGGLEITVTDAHAYLGRIPPERFLGGRMRLYLGATRAPMGLLAEKTGMGPVDTALGVLRVAEANMERAVRVISLERGFDPADFTLVSFGGAGGLHAARLADALSMPRVLVPPHPGALSACGMAGADIAQDASTALLRPMSERMLPVLLKTIDRLSTGLARSLDKEGVGEPEFAVSLALRYAGQSFEIPVAVGQDIDPEEVVADFHAAHERLYGARHPDRGVEVVAVRVRAVGRVPKPPQRRRRRVGPDPRSAYDETRAAVFPEGEVDTAFYTRERLKAGNVVSGPAVITEETATTVVPPDFVAAVDPYLNLVLTRR